ncbi:phosphate ABC transporter permease [Natrialbaceae archaeon A-gly3]
MIDVGTLALVLCGLVLLFAGAALSVYGVVLLGTVVGGGGGYLLGPAIGGAAGLEGPLAVAGTVVVGAAVGGALGYLLLSFTVSMVSFVVGGFLGLTVLSPLVSEQFYLQAVVAVVVGVVAALLATVLTRSMLIVITSVVGASLVSTSLTLGQFQTARESMSVEPLLFEVTPLFLALVALGILSQLGLFKFGYVTRLMRVLPGAAVIPRRRNETDSS